jgi:large subunit ribosomal protein L13
VKTYLAKKATATRNWRIVDADGKILGRLAVHIADALRGKDKTTFTPHVDTGDFVVVINAEKVRVTGKKETDKEYMTYSGWKGGEKHRSVEWIRARHPELLITRAVKGMLPKSKLGRQMLTKLKVYRGAEHPHAAQKPAPMKLAA